MAKTEKLFSKVVMILFLIMIVIGFTIPGFLQGSQNNNVPQQVEPRFCQTDADCYLLCEVPTSVLCYQNLCQQNSCEEYSLYPFKEDPLTFTLNIMLDEEQILLESRSNNQDSFITFADEKVQMFSTGLSLRHVLEKTQIFLDTCLRMDGKLYCNEGNATLEMFVNGETHYGYGHYIPQEGDTIELIYLK